MKLTLFVSTIPTYSLSPLPPSSSSCGLYWGWPLQGWSAQDETPPHCPRNRYSPAHNDMRALDGAVFAYPLPKTLDDGCNKLLTNLWTGRCLPLVEGNSLVLQFLKRWKNVQCLFSPCNACCEMTTTTCQRERSSEPRSSPYSLIPSSLPSWQIGCWSSSFGWIG